MLQAGTYRLSVEAPDVSSSNQTAVGGSPLIIAVTAGPADAAHCSATVTAPSYPVVGSNVSVEITLADSYGNPVTVLGTTPLQYNISRLQILGGSKLHTQC
jgi:hypothetical protein